MQARGSHTPFCKPWLRRVGVFTTRAAKQNHRMVGVGRDLCGSSSPTLNTTIALPEHAVGRRAHPSNGLGCKQYRAMPGFSDRASASDSSQNYSKHQCLGTAPEAAQQSKRNLTLIPPSPPPPVLICHETRGWFRGWRGGKESTAFQERGSVSTAKSAELRS